MLESISIQNYALIDQLDIDLSEGLNVITGETGAGKSIVINALTLLLGNRASKDNIRTGANKMSVSGQFSLEENSKAKDVLSENGIELEDELILSREVSRSGKNVCRINGQIVPLTVFKALGNHLVDIHSQHEHVALFNQDHQRELLDLYGGQELTDEVNEVRRLAVELKQLAKKIRELQVSTKEANRNHALNQFQLNEITEAALSSDEEEELHEREKELVKQEQLFNESYQAGQLLEGGESDEASISSLLSSLEIQLTRLAKIDDYFKDYQKSLNSIINEFNTFSFDLSSYLNNLEYNPQELAEIEERLSLIESLKGKYGETIEEILAYAENLQEQVDLYENADFLLDETKHTYKNIRNDYNKRAEDLTERRLKAAEKLKEELELELADLAMDKAIVEIELKTDKDIISPNGQDSVDFLISANPGQSPKALRQAASGGEISRIMLAIKGILGEKDQIETLIFDEIDTGISGRTAQVVAEKIVGLSQKRQIICITHLPQIAAMADSQFVVQKESDTDSTQVSFTQLEESKRVEELARMLGGAEVTEITTQNANEMLEQAVAIKQKLKDL